MQELEYLFKKTLEPSDLRIHNIQINLEKFYLDDRLRDPKLEEKLINILDRSQFKFEKITHYQVPKKTKSFDSPSWEPKKGLLAWSPNPKMVDATLDDLIHPFYQEPIKVGIVSVRTSSSGSDMEGIASCILNAASSGRYHIITAPEYSFLSKNGPISEATKNEFVESFKDASKNKVMIIPGTFVWKHGNAMSNTAYVFYDGKVIYEYKKMRDGGELSIARSYKLSPSYGTLPGLFNWEGLKLGIEICADGGVLGRQGVRNRDLVFLISAGNSGLETSMSAVRMDGYGIVAEGVCGHFKAKKQTKYPYPSAIGGSGLFPGAGSYEKLTPSKAEFSMYSTKFYDRIITLAEKYKNFHNPVASQK